MPRSAAAAARANVAAVVRPVADPAPRPLPYFPSPAARLGFPSPATDYVEESLDLNDYLIRNRPATFLVRFQGDSLQDLGILDGDIGAVDRSIRPSTGRIVVAAYDGEIVAKVFDYLDGRAALVSRNAAAGYAPLYLDACQDCVIWGCVTGVVRRL